MKNRFSHIVFQMGKIQPHHLRLFWLLILLALFVIGAGAPETGAGIGN